MITTLKFVDGAGTIDVEYKTSLMSDNEDNFQVMAIEGESDAEKTFGFNFRELAYDIPTFKAFATANSLKLTRIDDDGETVLVDATDDSSSSSVSASVSGP